MVLFCSDRPAIKAGLFSFGHMKWPGEWHHRAEGRGWVGNNMYFYITAEFGRDSLVRREAALEMPALSYLQGNHNMSILCVVKELVKCM